MPITPIPKALYPLVPNAPGVPPLLRSAAQVLDTITLGYLGIGDALNELIGAEPVRWGVFDANGNSIAEFDSMFSMDYRDDSQVSNYPVVDGSFAAYNKVDLPVDIVVVLSCGGSQDRRAAFQVAVRAARRSLQVFTVITPDDTYRSMNIASLNWVRRADNGANRIEAVLGMLEIRSTVSTAYNAAASASGADPQATGEVQLISDPTIDASNIA